MNYITTTDLRTKTPELINTLKNNGKVSLVHRSKVIGTIQPVSQRRSLPIEPKSFGKFLYSIKPKKLIPREKRDEVYRKNLMKKYGKHLS